MSKSYLPTLKDKDGNIIVGLMGQYDSKTDAQTKLIGDAIFFIPFGLTSAGITEYDSEVGLPNVEGTLLGQPCAIIAGPMFNEVMENQDATNRDGGGSAAEHDPTDDQPAAG